MWKMVASDLYCEFKPGLKKAFKRFLNYYAYLYLVCFAPILLHLSGKYLLYYYFAIIPMIFSLLFFTIYSGRPNKALYLCPLSAAQRKQYFLISWGIRAGLPSLLSLFLEGALFFSGMLSLSMALLVIASITFLSMTINLRGNAQNLGRGDKKFAYYDLWNALVLILGILVVILLSTMVGDLRDPRFNDFGGGLAIFLFFLCALTTLIVIVKYLPPVMEKMIDYEHEEEKEQ